MYKRQHWKTSIKIKKTVSDYKSFAATRKVSFWTFTIRHIVSSSRTTPVSYTHLDVYKRQDLNQAITIRTFVSRGNVLYYQAGAGLVAKSNDERELQEVNNKLGALKKACLLYTSTLCISLY